MPQRPCRRLGTIHPAQHPHPAQHLCPIIPRLRTMFNRNRWNRDRNCITTKRLPTQRISMSQHHRIAGNWTKCIDFQWIISLNWSRMSMPKGKSRSSWVTVLVSLLWPAFNCNNRDESADFKSFLNRCIDFCICRPAPASKYLNPKTIWVNWCVKDVSQCNYALRHAIWLKRNKQYNLNKQI